MLSRSVGRQAWEEDLWALSGFRSCCGVFVWRVWTGDGGDILVFELMRSWAGGGEAWGGAGGDGVLVALVIALPLTYRTPNTLPR